MRRSAVLGSRRRIPACLLALAGVAGTAASLVATPALAQDAEGVRVEAVGGYDGRYLSGRRIPITVSIQADRLVRGTVEVSFDDIEGTWSTPVEVPGGGEKDVVVVVPTPATFVVREARVRLVGAGEPVAVDVELDVLEGDQLVGLLPGTQPADLPPSLELPGQLGTARFVALEAELLALPGAIDPLGTVVAGAEEVGRLDAAARAQLLDWVDRGGRLVVDGAAGSPVAGVPEAWVPGDTGRAPAGLGEVRQSGGRAAGGDWAAVVEPTPTASFAELFNIGGMSPFQVESLGDSIARDAGLDALDLPWLLAFLAAYVVLAGPVGYLLIRRRRPGLGWIVVPALAVGFTGLAFLIGSDLRSGNRAAHGTVLETGPGGNRATTVVGTVSRAGADGVARFPEGWTAAGVDNSFFGFGSTGGAGELAVTTSGGRSEGTVPLAAGGFGVLRGSGPDDRGLGGLVIEARSEGDAVVGAVRNDLPFAVEEVGIFLGRATERLGTIGAGEEATFEITGDEFRLGDPFSPPEAQLWPGQAGFGAAPELDGVVNLAILNEATFALGPNGRPRGVVTAVGWTRELAAPVEVVGEATPAGRSAVVGRGPVAGEAAGLAPGAARRELLRGPDGVEVDDLDIPSNTEGAVWRFALPVGTGAVPLAVEIPEYIVRLEVWDGAAWQLVDDDSEDFDPNRGIDITDVRIASLPAAGLIDGVVLARGTLATDFGASDGAGLDLRAAGAAG